MLSCSLCLFLTFPLFSIALSKTFGSSTRKAHAGAKPQKLHQLFACFQSAKTALSLRRREHLFKWRSRVGETLVFGVTPAISSRRRSRLDGVHMLHFHDLRISV
jgi:hypothetical protein